MNIQSNNLLYLRNKPEHNYIPIAPKEAINGDIYTTFEYLKNIIGEKIFYEILQGKQIESPCAAEKDSKWMHQSKIVGINPRAVGTYFNIVKYAMTFPEDAIHIMPVFESGCQNSLYSPVNFQLSKEFMDPELERIGFNTPEKQLKFTINLLHAMGKKVGMDSLVHTDRFSEDVFLNPDNFIWAKIDDNEEKELKYPQINPDKLGQDVKKEIINFIKTNGDAQSNPVKPLIADNLYLLKEEDRRKILFGTGSEEQRTKRRIELMNHIRAAHFETKPVNIDDAVAKSEFKKMMHDGTNSWAKFTDFKEDNIFGNLTPYKLYHLDNNGNIDITKPNMDTWDYLCQKTLDFQQEYGFDFLRTDMGYLSYNDKERDIHAKIKEFIQQNSMPQFATFGECITIPENYGLSAITRKNYDAILGNLQYISPYNYNFMDIVKSYNFTPDYKVAVTSITADSDQKINNGFYDNFQNKIRYFLGLFLNQPSYMGMGLETRDEFPQEDQYFTRNFINKWGINKFEWGSNTTFFNILSGMRKIYAQIKDEIQNQYHYWLHTTDKKVASWFYYTKDDNVPSYLFTVNTDVNNKQDVEVQNIFNTDISQNISNKTDSLLLSEIYSSENNYNVIYVMRKGQKFKLKNLKSGECKVFKILNPDKL